MGCSMFDDHSAGDVNQCKQHCDAARGNCGFTLGGDDYSMCGADCTDTRF